MGGAVVGFENLAVNSRSWDNGGGGFRVSWGCTPYEDVRVVEGLMPVILR